MRPHARLPSGRDRRLCSGFGYHRQFALQFDTHRFLTWEYDADNKQILERLAQEVKDKHSRRTRERFVATGAIVELLSPHLAPDVDAGGDARPGGSGCGLLYPERP